MAPGKKFKEPHFEGKAWKIWFQDLNTKAPTTKREYLRNIVKFLDRWETTPDELYSMRMTDMESDDPRDAKQIERMVKTQMSELRASGYSAETCKQLRKSVKSFFESQEIDLSFKAKDSPRGASNGSRIALPEEVREMYDNMVFGFKIRNRAIVMFLKDTGLRVSDVVSVDVGDYLSARVVENGAGESFRVFRDPEETQKMKVNAYVHLGPEAVAAIDEYLEERRQRGEVFQEDTPLFLHRRAGERITDSGIKSVFFRVKKWLGDKGYKKSAHSLRKFHRTRLEGGGMPEGWVKILQGKQADVYQQPQHTGELTEMYVKCYDRLRVFGEQASTQKLDEQAQRIAELERLLDEERTNNSDRIEGLERRFIDRIEAMEERQREHFEKDK